MSSKIKALVGESSIVMHYNGEAITIQSATDRLLFEEIKEMIKSSDVEALKNKFIDVKARIEKYTDKNFYIKDKKLYLKMDDEPIPKNITKRLLELEAAGEDFMPLIRFWKKLKSNPSEESREQLYGFISHNNIPLTDMGDIVTEKGVKQKTSAPVGELVDCRTGAVDNSVGMEVYMNREEVDADPNQTCSHGLHVGAPEYVRKHYSSNIIIQCIVNPRDVVAVPKDYNNTKMRVSRYVVAGYSTKSEYKPVYNFKDFTVEPTEDIVEGMKAKSLSQKEVVPKDKKVVSKKVVKEASSDKLIKKFIKKYSTMTGKEIIKMVSKAFGIDLPHNPKSKTAIVRKAAKIAANHEEISKK